MLSNQMMNSNSFARSGDVRIAIFGASGRTGQHLVKQALIQGYEVTALVRTPAKFSLQHPQLTVIHGDIGDATAVSRAVSGTQAVISVLGPTSNAPDFAVSRGMQHILDAMRQHGVKRLIVSTGAGVGDPADAPRFINRLITWLLKMASKNVYLDMVKTAALVRASDRDWTIVRVPMLTDAPETGQIKTAYVGKGMGMRITRGDMAHFMLKQIEDLTYLRQAPAISN